jgi:hypothetical protein
MKLVEKLKRPGVEPFQRFNETFAKAVLAVAAVCDHRHFFSKFTCCRRSQSAATVLLQGSF